MISRNTDTNLFCYVAVILLAILALCVCVPAQSAEITITDTRPNETIAVQALIDQFDSQDYVVRYDLYSVTPAFAVYAEAAAKLDGATPMLIEVLANEPPAPGMAPPQFAHIGPYSQQARLAAAIALEAVGPEAILAEPLLRTMLESPDRVENIMACAIVRGIGPEAASLLSPLRTLLYASDFHTQYWACRAIAALGDAGEPAVADLCLLLTTDQTASVRRNACIALGEVAGCSADLDVVTEILARVAAEDYSHPVRVEAEAALVKFYGPPPAPPSGDEPLLTPPEVNCR